MMDPTSTQGLKNPGSMSLSRTLLRVMVSIVLLTCCVLPLFLLAYDCCLTFTELPFRLVLLIRNTLALVSGTLLIVIPFGTCFAVCIEKFQLPGRVVLRLLLLLVLFVPLPLLLAGWQPLLPHPPFWTPWPEGLLPATILHALAAFPWVVLIVGLGLRSVEPELEEDARIFRGYVWSIAFISLRRSRAAIGVAVLWIAMQTSGEIIVADLFQVRTLAEEVYTQLVAPEIDSALGGAVLVSLLGIVASLPLLLLLAGKTVQLVPPLLTSLRAPRGPGQGIIRWPIAALLLALTMGYLLIPVGYLLYRAGLSGQPGFWSFTMLSEQFHLNLTTDRVLFQRTLQLAISSGILCASVALIGCWLARDSRWFRILLTVVVALAWATPGPLLGLGVKNLLHRFIEWSDPYSPIPALLFWHGPSIAPLLLVNFIRFFPFAVCLLWASNQRIPPEIFTDARLIGLPPVSEFRQVIWPWCRRDFWLASLGCGVLSLGELSAGKLVSTPGAESFAEVLWTQMHFGVNADLACRCLWLLILILGLLSGAFIGAVLRPSTADRYNALNYEPPRL